jgi:hypothetical protein
LTLALKPNGKDAYPQILSTHIRRLKNNPIPGLSCVVFPYSAQFFAIFRPLWLRYTLSHFAAITTTGPSKFIVPANNMKSAINMAWEHGGADFQARFDKSTGQAQEMKEGALRVL